MFFVTLELHWTKSSPSLHILTASVAIHTTSSPHCCSLAYFRCHRYTYPCLHYSLTRLLQLTICWPLSGRLQCLDRVLRSATHLSGRIPKVGHVSNYILVVLH